MTGPACVLCGATDTRLRHAKPRDYDYGIDHAYDLYACAACGALMIHPMPTAMDEILPLYGDRYYTVSPPRHPLHPITMLEQAYLKRERRRVRGLIGDNGRILDVGCGSGAYLRMLAGANPAYDLHGVDLSIPEEALEDERVRFVQADYRAASYAPGSFDLIRMGNLIEHVPDPAAYAARSFELLKDGGVLVGETPNTGSYGHRVWKSCWGPIHAPRHLVLFNRTNLTCLLKDAGFREVRLESVLRPTGWTKSLKNALVRAGVLPPMDHKHPVYALILLATAPCFIIESLTRNASIMRFIARK